MISLLILGIGAASAASPPDAGAFAEAAVGEADVEVDAPADEEVASMRSDAAHVRDLIAGRLAPDVDPQTLFDVTLGDDRAIDLEAARLDLFLGDSGPDAAVRSISAGSSRGGARKQPLDASEIVSPALLAARLDLDRARLGFYRLGASQRSSILASHAAAGGDAAAVAAAADERAHEAELQREAALQAAKNAQSEGQRLVSTELARLLAVEGAQEKFETLLQEGRKTIAAGQEVTLRWQRQAQDARGPSSNAESTDLTYDDLRHALRGARDDLSVALDALSSGASGVPVAGPDPLAGREIDADVTAVRDERKRVAAEAQHLTVEEASLREDRAAQLLDEIDTLNRERLALLDFLSPDKRRAITGFTPAGLEQASSEVRQLTLILRYHRHVLSAWIASLRHPDRTVGRAVAGGAFGVFELCALVGAFVWWRRRSDALLRVLRSRAQSQDRLARLTEPSYGVRVLDFALHVHRPLEWLLLLLVLGWLLPNQVESILEVRVASSILTWTFGASFVIESINGLAGAPHAGLRTSVDVSALRLRSLRLVGRTIVAFGLVLVISSMVVGRGTIYEWVFSTCWLASIPILLILVRWWREVVFRRTDRVRKKSRFQQWVLANRAGWMSFIAATAGGVHLFAGGVIRAGRNWVGRFDVTRRFLAYLFRRELTKLGSERPRITITPLDPRAFADLGPETESAHWIGTDLDEQLAQLASRIRARRGGVIAIVGERGLGKTSALRKALGQRKDAILLDTPSAGVEALRAQLATSIGLGADASFEAAAQALEASPTLCGIFVDNAHRLVQPIIGGLATFDELLAIASKHCAKTTWVFTLDDVIWQFLELARGARPLFDEVIRIAPWRETDIVALLESRTEQAGLTPSFEHLLERLPAGADEIDKQEAIARRASDYYRLLWDYAFGNPSVALHMWRRSLGVDVNGTTCVQLFTAMDTSDFETLPDPAVFVLRAILQLSPAHATQIARATMLRGADVGEAIRYALARGYLEEHDGGYRVTWTWFRAMTLFLQRRHLLVIR
ncbi:MAG: AAA family ATPase [Polyangiaceae bacterium]